MHFCTPERNSGMLYFLHLERSAFSCPSMISKKSVMVILSWEHQGYDFASFLNFCTLCTCWSLIINACWILSNALSMSIEIIIDFWSFVLLMWYLPVIDLWTLKHPCILKYIPLDHTVWSFKCIIKFRSTIFYWGFLHLCSSGILGCTFLSFLYVVWFWY